MWHVSISSTHDQSLLVMVDHLSYPLVVAVDEGHLWFLNARPCVN